MAEYTITLTDAEDKALRVVALDPQEWIDNAVHQRCSSSMDEIYNNEVARMTADPDITTIPADKNQVILNAVVQTAAERQAALIAQLEAEE
jgi:hypothetical protein